MTPIDYLHPELQPVLASACGVTLYQERVMQLAQVLAGYTRGGPAGGSTGAGCASCASAAFIAEPRIRRAMAKQAGFKRRSGTNSPFELYPGCARQAGGPRIESGRRAATAST